MSNYNSHYFIMESLSGDDVLSLTPMSRTRSRRFRMVKLPPIGEPLFFENAFKEEFKAEDIKYEISEILMESLCFLCMPGVKDYLSSFDIEGLQFYPSVFIDDDSQWHDEYWYTGFHTKLDCWDRKLSKIVDYGDDDEDDDDIEIPPTVEKFVLDSDVLDKIPEEERLLFVMGGVFNPHLFVHKRIVQYFIDAQVKGFHLYKLDDYEEGDEIMGINAMTV